MSSAFARTLVVAAISLALVTTSLGAPASSEPAAVTPEVVTARLGGLPALRSGDSTSRPVATPMPFSMVGFEVPPRVQLEFRTSEDGTVWGPWTPAEVNRDDGPDPGTAEARTARGGMSEPQWVGEATHVQTRVHGEGPAAHPENAGVHLIDSVGLNRSLPRRVLDRLRAAWRGGVVASEATARRPTIVSRAQWGADESLRRGSPVYAPGVVAGIVHHTAGSNTYTREQAPAVIRGIYQYHTRSKGWSDIGYHLLVDRYGTVYEGRAGGVTQPVIGAHSGGFNTGTFGVALVGSFDTSAPPAAMRDALDRVLAWKYDVHHVDVMGTTRYTSYGSTKYPAGYTITMNRLAGHRDVSATACPGANVYSTLDALRQRVTALQGPVFLEPSATPSTAQIVNATNAGGPVTFTTRLRPAGTWRLRVRDPAGTVVHDQDAGGVETTRASVSWIPRGAVPGTYRYLFTSSSRRKASGTVRFEQPAISGSASPSAAFFDADGRLRQPVTVSGSLYHGATWQIVVRDPAGQSVFSRGGQGSTAAAVWAGGATIPGTYTWSLAADGGTPVTGRVALVADRVGRLGRQADAVRAAAEVSRQTFTGTAAHVVLTRDDMPNVALAAGPLAGRRGPVLYTGHTRLPRATRAELERVLPAGRTVYVVGDTSVVDRAVERELLPWTVVRTGGGNPFQIAARIARLLPDGGLDRGALVVGTWREGIGAAAYGARSGIPVLLTTRAGVPSPTRNAVATAPRVTVVGTPATVSESVRRQLGAARVGGADAETVAVSVSRLLHGRVAGKGTDGFVFVNTRRSDGWVRAVAATPGSARTGAPVLLTGRDSIPAATGDYLASLAYSPTAMGSARVLGNTDHVSEHTRDALSRHLQ